MASSGPSVLAVLVATDGETWLPTVLAALESQTYPDLDVIAVDNGSRDGSREVLLSRLSEDRVLVAERDLGFAGAVSMALDADPGGDLVLLLHDDVALRPDAVEHLVAAITADPRVAIVGPKLIDWHHPDRLQQVGWTVDITGRADLGLEPDERDQGQRDEPRRPLVVSTAGMLVRRDVFEALGRFDRRYHVFRDDLDLCWRAWMAGWEVEVVPAAAGRHVRAAAGYHRLGQSALLGPRYFAERNTLATLLKNYGAARLLVVVPLFLLVGMAKVVGFVATRQVGDAWQTVRAWVWNLLHLRRTLQLRRQVQRMRRRTDAELRDRFGRIGPRARAYGEAVADRVTGGDLRVEPPAVAGGGEPRSVTARALAALRRHPVGWSAAALLLLGLVVAFPLLPGGTLRGGELAPFPASPGVFFEDYVASWHDVGHFGTSEDPSPSQALLGLLQVVTLGNAYAASRLLVLGAVPLAWLLTLRAVRPLAPTRAPRVAAATIYVLSPTALAAVRTGRIGALVVLVGLPAFLSAVVAAMERRPDVSASWRATAAATFVGAGMVAFEPVAALGVLAVHVLAALRALFGPFDAAGRRRMLARVATMVVGTAAVLFPWSLSLLRPDGPVTGGLARPGAAAQPFWRWLLQAPDVPGFAGIVAGAGVLLAGVFGILFAARRRGTLVAGLWAAAIAGAALATIASRAGADAWVWPGVPLLLTSAAFAGLFAVGLRSVTRALEEHDFGWRQVGAGIMVVGAVVGAGAALSGVVADRWSGYAVGTPALPAFITATAEDEAPDFRVVTVADRDGVVRWDVTSGNGLTMAAYGTPPPRGFVDTVDDAIRDVVGGADPGAGGRLGLLNVRYVVVPAAGASDELERALAAQLDLQPRPVAEGLVYEVTAHLPRVAWVPRSTIATVERRGTPPTDVQAEAFDRIGSSTYRGEVDGRGGVIVSETEVADWFAELDDGRLVGARRLGGIVQIEVPEDAGEVVVDHGGQRGRTTAVAVQVLAVLLVLSVMLRPPSFAIDRGAV